MTTTEDRPAAVNVATAKSSGVGKVILSPPSGWRSVGLRELWRYRELTWFLALRDIKGRYKQTVLGVAWAVIQPVMNTLVFTLFFHKLAGVSAAGNIPYPVATFCALLPWQLFESSLTQAGNSLVGNQNLITKVFFPRLAIPISSILSAIPDFVIGLILLAGLMAWYGVAPGWGMVALPLFVLLALGVALGVGLWLSALNVKYRDVRYAIPFLTRLWFFATPVIYPASTVGEKLGPKWQTIYGLNPMVGVVEGFRWALLGKGESPGPMVWVSVATTLLVLFGGLLYFRRLEQEFADIV